MQLILILFVTTVSSLVSLIGAFFLSLKKKWPQQFLLQMTAFSSGTLLATALLHLIPEVIEELEPTQFSYSVFLAIVVFFFLEKIVLWHHHHEHHSHNDSCGPHPSTFLVMISDSLHNFIDGILIASSFLLNPSLGIVTALAVAAHEIPQEIADYSILVAGGIHRKKALLLNVLSAGTAVLGALVGYYFGSHSEKVVPYAVAFSAGMFLYIALSDLIPELHRAKTTGKEKWHQAVWFVGGILVVVAFSLLEIEAAH